jgi:serine/threonine-protein phosphatase 4 regulatory subunit 2
MPSDDDEEVLAAFSSGDDRTITEPLQAVLRDIASSGQMRFAWPQLKVLLAAKVQQVCADYYETNKDVDASGEPYADSLKRLLALLDEFPNAPFTSQRLCELLVDPRRVYASSTRKMMNAVEKLLTVSSTVPTMQCAVAKPGSYQSSAEFELTALASGELPEGGDSMDITN